MKQPEALRLADVLERSVNNPHRYWQGIVAAELRRLHEVNQELLEALGELVANANGDARIGYYDVPVSSIKNAIAAIAKAGGAS